MIWRIYRYYNPIEDKSYVGQTTLNVNYRANHGNGYTEGTPFREAINLYGWENFEQSILRLCTSKEEADQYERYFIEKYNTIYPNGYNLQNGGWKHRKLHSITVQKMSEAHKGLFAGENHPMYNRHHTEEAKKKISESSKGRSAGKHWFNNGIKNTFVFDCPEGYLPGRLK